MKNGSSMVSKLLHVSVRHVVGIEICCCNIEQYRSQYWTLGDALVDFFNWGSDSITLGVHSVMWGSQTPIVWYNDWQLGQILAYYQQISKVGFDQMLFQNRLKLILHDSLDFVYNSKYGVEYSKAYLLLKLFFGTHADFRSHSLYLSDKVFEDNSFCESWYNWRYRYRSIFIRALWLIDFWQRDDPAIFNCWGTTPHRSEVLMFNIGSAEECAFSDQTQKGIPSGPMLVLLVYRMPSNTCRSGTDGTSYLLQSTFIGTLLHFVVLICVK